MRTTDRRKFLQLIGSGAFAAALPGSIKQALAIPANNRTGTIKDVEHIVILTQENRSFDQYFGTLRGVRGFGDPRAVTLPSGKTVWHQPDGAAEVLPFRPDVSNLGLQFVEDVAHGWNDSHGAWNNGIYDRWIANKGTTAMSYLTRHDIPFHYALADAFTVCDAYYCSLMGPTDPNRYHLWTGWTGNDGNGGGPVITNAEAGYDWSSYPERLQTAGISWKVYQDAGVGLDAAGYWGWTDDAYIGNYGDNSLLYLHQYQNALPGTPLADNAKTGTNIAVKGTLFDMFREDVRTGNLPQVSWIVAPEAYSEHPNFPPNYGAWYISQIIEALTAKPELWSKTALFINYDEAGGFFDHMIPPTPPQTRAQGLTTVDAADEIFPGDADHPGAPYGLGTRVPMLVVSPWSKGGWVNSQVFDHTSVIRFLEARFGDDHPGLHEDNITEWRRSVAGDLTSAFDFKTPNSTRVRLPNTTGYLPADKLRHPDYVPLVPAQQELPAQEPGVRPARALPYQLHAHGRLRPENGTFRISFDNTGEAAAVFHVRSGNAAGLPRSYTVESRKHLSDTWSVAGHSTYDLSVYGPNGFMRSFKGSSPSDTRSNLDVKAVYYELNGGITVIITNKGSKRSKVRVLDNYSGEEFEHLLQVDKSVPWQVTGPFGWYDLLVTDDEDPTFAVQLAGHVETGEDSATDPAIGGLVRED